MRTLFILIGSLALVSGEVLWTGGASRLWERHKFERDNPRAKLESRFSLADIVLHQLPMTPAEDASIRTLTIPRTSLRAGTLYLRDETSDRAFVYADADGYLHRDGAVIRQATREFRLLTDGTTIAVFADSALICELPRNRWSAFLASTESATLPDPVDTPRVSIRDGFMRERFADDNWKTITGKWNLRQRGGGLPDTEREAESYDVQRAVNPFSLLGAQNGQVVFGRRNLPHARIAARFYFGRPMMKDTVDYAPTDTTTDALLTVGTIKGQQYAFGWHGIANTFCLLKGIGPGTWELVKKYDGPHPPLTNWIKLELQLHRGSRLIGMLDNSPIFNESIPESIDGIFGIASGNATIELDDVQLDTLPLPAAAKGSPIYVKSRGFAAKKIKNGRDPIQFQQWARGSNTFTRSLEKVGSDRILRRITTRIPIYGDLTYESVPYHEEAGGLPSGKWQIRLTETKGNDSCTIEAEKSDKGWQIIGLPEHVWPKNHREFTLRISRSAKNNDQPTIVVNNREIPIGNPVHGPLQVAIGRWYQQGDRLDPPDPEHHVLRDGNLKHEFFEEAATDWNWIDGGFRMAARWACQAQWNFMACGSPGTPYLSSKSIYSGDQEHDYHMTVRPCTPWDAGDENWIYTRKQFDHNRGWYSRHNLNFSFCANPKNPLSGYSIVFAGDDNERTMFLKNGIVMASTDDPDFLMSKKNNTLAVHWSWWHFHVRKTGNRIQVECNDEPLFDVIDPDPLLGGHIGFWTVRNGFVVSRVTSAAESVIEQPHAAYVPSTASSSSFWRPLHPNTLTHSESDELDRFTMNSGAGFQAVRHVYAEPIDLNKTSTLNLNVKVSDNAKVNAHLQIDGKGYLIQLTAPTTDMKRILIPEGELTSEQFRISALSESSIKRRLLTQSPPGQIAVNLGVLLKELRHSGAGKLEAITIGNSSNTNYLLAGGGGNTANEWYEISTPRFE